MASNIDQLIANMEQGIIPARPTFGAGRPSAEYKDKLSILVDKLNEMAGKGKRNTANEARRMFESQKIADEYIRREQAREALRNLADARNIDPSMLPQQRVNTMGARYVGGQVPEAVPNIRRVSGTVMPAEVNVGLPTSRLDTINAQFSRIEPISVTGSPASDKAVNDVIKAKNKLIEQQGKLKDAAIKVETAEANANAKTGGLFSKMKGFKPTALGFVKGIGTGAGGELIGRKIEDAIFDTNTGIGSTIGSLGGLLATGVPYLGTGLALLGAANLGSSLLGLGEEESKPDTMAQQISVIPQQESDLSKVLRSLAEVNRDVANQRSGYKSRLSSRGEAMNKLDLNLLK